MSTNQLKRILAFALCMCMMLAYVPMAQAAELAITKHPSNVTIASGQTAMVSVTATGDGLSYRWYYKDAGSSTYSKSSVTTSTYSLVMKDAYNGRRVYCCVTDKNGATVNSNSALLTVATPLKITKQPSNVSVASGATATVSVTATGDGLSYRWYYKDAGSSTFGKSGVTSASYSLKVTAANSGRQVYCVVTDKYGKTVQSNTVTLSVAAGVKITKQPSNVTAASGQTVTVSVAATGDGLSYRWYYKDAGSSVYSKSSVTAATYTLVMKDAYNGRRVYCCVTDKYGNTVNSNSALLSLPAGVKITKQPSNAIVANGATATVSVTATGDGLTYRWYYADAGSTTFAKSSVTTASYSLLMSAARNGRRVYCVVTDKYGNTVQSNTVTLSLAAGVKITKQPSNAAVASGETATVSVTATGDGLTYRWYYADAGSTTFAKSSVTTASYSLQMNAARNGRRVYCVVTDKYGNTVQSNTVSLIIGTALKITKQPGNMAVASGSTATVSVVATGDGVTYRWYYADAGSSTFAKSSVTTASYSLQMSAARNGRRVYCVITDKHGNTLTSDIATLYVGTPLTIKEQPIDVSVASGETAEVTIVVTGDGVAYRWYYADPNSNTFYKSSVATATYSLLMNEARDGRRVYCEVTDKYGQKISSNIVTLSMADNMTEDGLVYEIANNQVTIISYAGTGAQVTIPATINNLPVKAIGASAFANCTKVTGITIPNSVTSIGNAAFSGCTALTSLKIPSGVTSISVDLCNGCTSLASVTLPNAVTVISARAFRGCTSLKTMSTY